MSSPLGKVIRDAVHGDVELTDVELTLVDTVELQRLRGIKQLGTAHLVYPSAVHTRFEHSLGTLHVAARLVGRLPRGTLDPDEVAAVRAAALLHDITHIPFGHTLEDERRLFDRHDSPGRTRAALARGALGRALAQSGLGGRVEAILTGEAARPLLSDVVSGTIGADLLDYLLRDSLFCGLRTAYDERIFRYFTVARDRAGEERLALRISKRGLLRADAVSELLHILRLRYTLCERVYFHHAKVAAGAAISRAVEMALREGLVLEDLLALGDAELLAHLRARFAGHGPLQRLLDRLASRSLYQRAYVLTRAIGEPEQAALVGRYHADRDAREALETELAAAIGVPAEDLIVYCPEPRMAMKEADIPVVVEEGGPPVPLGSLGLPEVPVLLDKHRDLWRFFVLLARDRAHRAGALAEACRERLGHASMLGARPLAG